MRLPLISPFLGWWTCNQDRFNNVLKSSWWEMAEFKTESAWCQSPQWVQPPYPLDYRLPPLLPFGLWLALSFLACMPILVDLEVDLHKWPLKPTSKLVGCSGHSSHPAPHASLQRLWQPASHRCDQTAPQGHSPPVPAFCPRVSQTPWDGMPKGTCRVPPACTGMRE